MSDTETTYDPYAGSVGLIDDFDGLIQDASFGIDAGYNESAVLLILDVTTPDPDRPLETLKLSCGTGWEIEDGGRRVVKTNGKQQFNNRTRIQLTINAALKAGAGNVMRAKGTPMEAATWQGLHFHWLRQPVEGMNGETKDVLLPSKFLGGAGNATASSSSSEGLSAVLKAKLTAAAKASSDFGSFIDAAFAIDGVNGNVEAEALASSEDFYNAAQV